MLQVEIVLKHLLTTVGRMFRRVAISFAAVFVVVFAVGEGIGAALTKEFPGTGLTHAVAIIIGFSLALNVALAIAIEEGLRGFIALVQDVAKATEKVVENVAHEVVKDGGQLFQAAEHEISTLTHDAGHLVQNIEHGAVVAARDVIRVPGQIIGGVEGGVQGIERRFTSTPTEQP